MEPILQYDKSNLSIIRLANFDFVTIKKRPNFVWNYWENYADFLLFYW